MSIPHELSRDVASPMLTGNADEWLRGAGGDLNDISLEVHTTLRVSPTRRADNAPDGH